MTNWKPNMKCVFVNNYTPAGGRPITLVLGSVHTVARVQSCVCGTVRLDVGCTSPTGNTTCAVCGARQGGDIWWMNASRFRPLHDADNEAALSAIEQEVEQEQLLPA